MGWALSLLLPLIAVGIGILGRGLLGLSTDVVLFFLATVITALVGGLGPALLASVATGLLLNFFLTPPLYTFTISERENVITLVAMVLVAVLVALVVDRAARRAQQAAQARTEATLLASFSRTVLSRSDPLPRLLERIREAFGLTSVGIMQRKEGRWTVSAAAGPAECSRPEDADVDVAVDIDTHLVGEGRALTAADRRLLDAVAGQALLALRNQQVSSEAAEAKRRADATELRSALLSAVGHDLRTPLASIKAAAGSLRDATLQLSEADRTELAATIEESADRLTGVVNNLLDSSRIATGAVTPGLQPVRYDEVALLALRGLDGADRVRLDIADDLPEVLADPGLLERVVANLVDNALRHGRGSPVTVRASAHDNRVELRIVDGGPGVPADRLNRLFAPFQRLGDREPRGLGLGLSVARGFTEAMGGTLNAEDTPGGGLTTVVSLPAIIRSAPAVVEAAGFAP
jgi:two-component system sensor histidine kinase KdpD